MTVLGMEISGRSPMSFNAELLERTRMQMRRFKGQFGFLEE